MGTLSSRTLFFTTSPRTPAKMIPEITLISSQFNGEKWNKETQARYMSALAETDFFKGEGSDKDKAFSARDRINRAPQALGFLNLKPKIQLTEAGEKFIEGKRQEEIFLRQILKFQIPSPYHLERKTIAGTFCVKPYLETLRLVRELGFLGFDELQAFGMQLTDYRNFDLVKTKIEDFRIKKETSNVNYKKFYREIIDNEIQNIYKIEIQSGKTKTRQSKDTSLKKYIATKRQTLRDYTDACFRYLRATGLVTVSHRGHSISIFKDKLVEVDYILTTIDRNPVYVNDVSAYKAFLFNASLPILYTDQKDNIIDSVMRISSFTRNELLSKTVEELKDLRDLIVTEKREAYVKDQVAQLKSYALYSEIIDTYNEIISDDLYDAPLMLEWNTWRAMTMLDGGNIRGNFKVDDIGNPMSTAQGNMPDIECDYNDFALSVEVTLQNGQRQYESEGEPVARHYAQLKKRSGKETYCLFITPTLNNSALAHFYILNKTETDYYVGKAKIVPLELDKFMKLIENSYNFQGQPTSKHMGAFLEQAASLAQTATGEQDWLEKIYKEVDAWPAT